MGLLTLLLLLPHHGGCSDLPDPVELPELVLAKDGKGGGGGGGEGGGGRSGSSGRGSAGSRPTASKLSKAGEILKNATTRVSTRPGAAVTPAHERRRLLILHGKVARYYRTVYRTLYWVFGVTVITVMISITVLGEIDELRLPLLALLLAIFTVYFSALSESLAEWAVEAYSDVILKGGGYREAVDAFWRYGVPGMAVLASLTAILTACCAHAAFRTYSREIGKGTRHTLVAVAPFAILTVLAAVGTAADLWALEWGLWVTG